MRNVGFMLVLLVVHIANFAVAGSATKTQTIENLEEMIRQDEAATQKAKLVEAARQAEIAKQAQVKRDAAAAAAKKAMLIIKSDTSCQLSVNGDDRGMLEAQTTKRLSVNPGEQLIECVRDGRRVEKTETVGVGLQSVVKISMPPPGPKERFERVAEGVKDNELGLIWAERDNGSDINWNKATLHCSSFGSGWTLPSSAALLSMYDASGHCLIITVIPLTQRSRQHP